MKLYSGPTSPFARKVRIVALEHGHELELLGCNPFEDEALERVNPLRFIPALELEDDTALFDSDVICRYLNLTGEGTDLYPAADQWTWMTRRALGDGLSEASVAWQLQKVLPDDQRSAIMVERYQSRVMRTVAALEKEVYAFEQEAFRMDHIAAICGLGHVELRHGKEWRKSCPKLADWYQRLMLRTSIAETAPPVS